MSTSETMYLGFSLNACKIFSSSSTRIPIYILSTYCPVCNTDPVSRNSRTHLKITCTFFCAQEIIQWRNKWRQTMLFICYQLHLFLHNNQFFSRPVYLVVRADYNIAPILRKWQVILRRNGLHPYHFQRVQQLLAKDEEPRICF